MIIIRWFISKTVRQAVALRRHVSKLLAAQRDVLSPPAIEAVAGALTNLRAAVEQGKDKAMLLAQMENLEKTANQWLKPYPHAAWRENVEVFLVALGVAMAIRTFFLQPFKIPTGSMQPTLYGVTPSPLTSGNQPDLAIPGRLARLYEYWVHGRSYFHVVAPEDGQLRAFKPPVKFLLFNLKQEYLFNEQWHTVWFPCDQLFERACYVANPRNGELARFNPKTRELTGANPNFRNGEDIIRLQVLTGDHLFVNRVTYNFRHPQRGEIIVFSTRGIDPDAGAPHNISPDQYYIKRLVALGGERVQIGSDQHLIINGQRLDSGTPHFENVYNFRPNAGENEYFGHTQVAMFGDPDEVFQVQPNHYMVMGDNTRNSLDSRFFGDFSREYVIGKSSFVYWPISSRFGFGYY